jgi:hypothetical protein
VLLIVGDQLNITMEYRSEKSQGQDQEEHPFGVSTPSKSKLTSHLLLNVCFGTLQQEKSCRILSSPRTGEAIIHLGRPLPAASCDLPECPASSKGCRRSEPLPARRPALLRGLAPSGVCRAPDVAIRAVSSYLAFSPFPRATVGDTW